MIYLNKPGSADMTEPEISPLLATQEYRTLTQIKGPLIFLNRVNGVAYNELLEIIGPDGEVRRAWVLEVDGDRCVVQVFTGTSTLDLYRTRVLFSGHTPLLGVSKAMLGRVLDSSGHPIDGGPPVTAEAWHDIHGLPINPSVRAYPSEFIQTGISTIDGLNSLARGQKLPIFSGAGLPANQLAAQITAQARVMSHGKDDQLSFAVVFAAIGITQREVKFFQDYFQESGGLERTAVFVNYASDPAIERLLTPRVALTLAEHLAFNHNLHVLVIMTDITNYCEALREVGAAREDVPGRRGYPGYMYSDLASMYERTGRIKGKAGSVTQLPILTMPDDDITHPIPDLTGYITEGQIVLSRELHHKGIYPPVEVLPSLSRLMNAAIGEGKTRVDHRSVANQLYALYAQGQDLRRLVAIIGDAALSAIDQRILAFADHFEARFVGQGLVNRSLEETLNIAWELLNEMPARQLTRIPQQYLDSYHQEGRD
jgi:V/A-type H+-transporting ATPase subunit B